MILNAVTKLVFSIITSRYNIKKAVKKTTSKGKKGKNSSSEMISDSEFEEGYDSSDSKVTSIKASF